MCKLNFVFIGGMTISHQVLAALCGMGHIPSLAIGYAPTLSHRSNYCSLKHLAAHYGFALIESDNINSSHCESNIASCQPDWLLVIGWSQIVNTAILKTAKNGALGFHMSLLPQGRGRAPVPWSIIKGLDQCGVTLQLLKEGVDDGDIVMQRSTCISQLDDAETITQRINNIAVEMLLHTMPDMLRNSISSQPQDKSKATYWKKRNPADGLIDWNLSIDKIYDFIRGVTHPFPGAYTYLDSKKLTVWTAAKILCHIGEPPGTILGSYVCPGCHAEVGVSVSVQGGILILKNIAIEYGTPLDNHQLLDFVNQYRGYSFSAIDSKSENYAHSV